MSQLKIATVVATAACACGSMAATAPAKIFKATRTPNPITEAEPAKTIGHGEGIQEFHFGVFTILCEKAGAKGIVDKEFFRDFAIQIKFGKCLTKAKFGTFTGGIATKFNEGKPIGFVYHINGFAEVGEAPEGTEVKISGGEANFKISAKLCKISWPAQTVPAAAVKKPEEEFSAVVYSNEEIASERLKKFPSGFQKVLKIANEFKGMEFFYEEGQCVGEGGFEEEAPHTEGKTAKYTGNIRELVSGGNIEVTEEEPV
jgi:hypothetical protein